MEKENKIILPKASFEGIKGTETRQIIDTPESRLLNQEANEKIRQNAIQRDIVWRNAGNY